MKAKPKKRKRAIDERTSGRDTHCTPRWLVERIAKMTLRPAGKPIGLDPCGSKRAPATELTRVVMTGPRGTGDGLKMLTWHGYGLVFANPPYGTQVRLWARKMVEEFGFNPERRRTVVDELIVLVAARVDTRWFKLLWRHSSAVLLFDRRLTFVGQKDPAKFPSALIYFGSRPDQFSGEFFDLGLVIENITPTLTSASQVDDRTVRLHFPLTRR